MESYQSHKQSGFDVQYFLVMTANSPRKSVGPYDIIQKIGEGSQSEVFLGRHRLFHGPLAIKIVYKDENPSELKYMEQEIDIMQKCVHPHILEFFDIVEEEKEIAIIMGYATNGTLATEILKKGILEEKNAHKFFMQLLSAVEYLHFEKQIIHRDIKAENVLIDGNGDCRLGDFGYSKPTDGLLSNTACGTPAYMSPEVITKHPYTYPSDIWSLGILLYLMVTGKFPFMESSITKMLSAIVEKEPYIPMEIDPSLGELILRMLHKDPDQRATIKEIKANEWVLRHMHENAVNVWTEATEAEAERLTEREIQSIPISDNKDIFRKIVKSSVRMGLRNSILNRGRRFSGTRMLPRALPTIETMKAIGQKAIVRPLVAKNKLKAKTTLPSVVQQPMFCRAISDLRIADKRRPSH